LEFRKIIIKYFPADQILADVQSKRPTITIPDISLNQVTSIYDILPPPIINEKPLSFEKLEQAYGFVLYRNIFSDQKSGLLKIKDLRDYGIVFINGKRVGILDRRLKKDSLFLDLPKGKVLLDILVENLGRINFGPYLLNNNKGITENVLLNNIELSGWQMFCLPFEKINFENIKTKTPVNNFPVLRKSNFTLQTIGDTYLDMSDWGKGCVWVNGYNSGRYWSIGPQQTLYVPAEWLKKGSNEIIVLELLKPEQTQLRGIETPILDSLK